MLFTIVIGGILHDPIEGIKGGTQCLLFMYLLVGTVILLVLGIIQLLQ